MDSNVTDTQPAEQPVEIPRALFFDAKDYAPHAKPRTKPTEVQGKVARARREQLAGACRIHERLGTALRHVRVADEYGMAVHSIDVLVATAEDFLAATKRLVKAAENAEARYEEAIEQGPDAPTPTAPETPTTGRNVAGALPLSRGMVMGINGAQPGLIAGYIDGLAVPASPLLTDEAAARIRAARASASKNSRA